MKKLYLAAIVLVMFVLLSVLLIPVSREGHLQGGTPVQRTTATTGEVAHGELIYVPVYSKIFYEDSKNTLELAATLSIHNVNPEQSITVTKADYYNTAGQLIKKYATEPITLKPLETKHWVIEKTNTSGGLGANFLVEWHANAEVVSPIVETLMVNAAHNLGIAFTSNGKVIKRLGSKPE